MRFKNQVALVTGSSRGIGKSVALAFAKEGANVVVNYNNKKDLAEEVVESIKAMGCHAFAIKSNVRDFNQVENMVEKTLNEFGKIDILVNNAGYYKDSTVWKMTDEVWEDVIGVNLKGTFNCTKAVTKNMREQEYGRIINISSVVGQVGVFGTSNYSAAKSGLFGFTKAVAREVIKKNITVNTLALGYFDTGMMKRLPKKVQDSIIQQIPIGRVGNTDEVGHTVLFLASRASSYLTGQVMHLNGGYYM